MTESALSVRDMSMTFPGTRALDRVSIEVLAGEVHGLVGHNGSGKSTLIKILSGLYVPDGGSSATLWGNDLPWESPAESERLGLRVVHQNLGLIPSMTVTENINLGTGYDARIVGRISWRRENKRAAELMGNLGYDVDPRTPVVSLPAAARSAVAIARALLPRAGQPAPKLLLLDEVTATMPEVEIDRLLDLVRNLKAQGTSILYVSHHLSEVLDVCDSVTVLKDGRVVVSVASSTLTMTSLADHVVGSTEWRENLPSTVVEGRGDESVGNEAYCQVRNLEGLILKDLSFDASPGRIVGITGITGSGREEVAELLMGAHPRGGEVLLGGAKVPDGSPRRAVKMGMTLLPAERLRSAVIPTQNVRENLTLSSLRRLNPMGLLTARREKARVKEWISSLTIRGASTEGSMSTLSGGNQQKVILARCLDVNPKVLVLDEPTQGVDVGAVADIHARIREISHSSSVIVCSSDSYELTSLCTEVLVLQRGLVVGHLHGDEVTESNLDHLQLAQLTSSRPAGTTIESKDI